MVEEVVDGSLTLLDISSSTTEVLSQMKESILHLQSSLCRGRCDEGIHAYLMSRKKISKAVLKCLVILNKVEKDCRSETDVTTVRIIKEAKKIGLSTVKSVLSYLAGKKAMSQTRGWSLVAKLVKFRQSTLQEENASEIDEIDSFLQVHVEKHSNVDVKCRIGHQ